MRAHRPGPVTLLTVLLALSASDAQDPKGKESDKPAGPVDASTLKAGEYFGKLLNPPDRAGRFTVRIDLSRYEAKDAATAARANGQLNADLQQARQLEQQVAQNPSDQQLARLNRVYDAIRQDLARQRDAYKVIPDSKDVEFHASGDMAVRFLLPPVVYDDKGELKRYRLIDLKEMRGVDPSVPGYEAKLTDLQSGQIVRVSLRPAPEKLDGAGKAKPGPKMEATMALIVVAEDMTPVDQPKAPPKRKKKAK